LEKFKNRWVEINYWHPMMTEALLRDHFLLFELLIITYILGILLTEPEKITKAILQIADEHLWVAKNNIFTGYTGEV